MLIRELSSENARKSLMTDAEFSMLTEEEQAAEINRAVNAAHFDRSLIHMAYSTPPPNAENTNFSKNIMIITAVSMMIGFAMFIFGLFKNQSDSEVGGLIIAIGLILAAGVPAVCYAVDKIRTELAQKRTGSSISFSEYDADSNYSDGTPPQKVLWTGGIGTALVAASLVSLSIFRGDKLSTVFGALFFAGSVLLSVSLRLNKQRDYEMIMYFPALLGLMLLFLKAAAAVSPEAVPELVTKCFFAYFCLLALSPLIFNIIKLIRCRKKVIAECIDVEVFKQPRSIIKMKYYRAYWAYTVNGRAYLHRDLTSHSQKPIHEHTELRVNPKDPHDIHKVLFPSGGALILLFCAMVGIFTFMAAQGTPIS